MQANIDSIQASLDDEIKRSNAIDSERVKLLVSEKILKRQLQLRTNDSEDDEDFKYRLDRAVAKERQSETIIKSL